jgi:hypothetical protein
MSFSLRKSENEQKAHQCEAPFLLPLQLLLEGNEKGAPFADIFKLG